MQLFVNMQSTKDSTTYAIKYPREKRRLWKIYPFDCNVGVY